MNLGADVCGRIGLAVMIVTAAASACGLNVRDFGAAGDGRTDDFPAIQRALDAASDAYRRDRYAMEETHVSRVSSTAPEVFLPRGVYRLSRPLLGSFCVMMRGEEGTVIECADPAGLAIYVEVALRGVFQNLVFRGGMHHIAFWTQNKDTCGMLIENCRFENAAAEAVFTESFSHTSNEGEAYFKKRNRYVGSYEVTRDAYGLPVLKRTVWTSPARHSTRFVMRRCVFSECGAAYRGATDGQYFSHLVFRSSREQTLPVFSVGTVIEMSDVTITANLPPAFPHAWIEGLPGETALEGDMDLVRVAAASTSSQGAPLVSTDARPWKDNWWALPYHVRLEECTADAARSAARAFVHIRRTEPALLTVLHCRETHGEKVDLLKMDIVPQTSEDLQQALRKTMVPRPDALTHRWTVDGNGSEIRINIPDILAPCREERLPPEAFAGYPALDAPVVDPCAGHKTILRAAAFGVGSVWTGEDETAGMQRLLDAAASVADPVVELPGRTITIASTLTLPRRVKLVVRGFGTLQMLDPDRADKDIFRVAAGTDPLAISFENLGFRHGRYAMAATGNGNIFMKNGTVSPERGFKLTSIGETPMKLEIVDSSCWNSMLVEATGCDVRLKDSWVETLPGGETPNYFVLHGGTFRGEHVLGVPIVGTTKSHRPERLATLKDDQSCAWFLNDGANVRLRCFRFGGEFGGYSPMELRGKGRALVEGSRMTWSSPSGYAAAFFVAGAEVSLTVNGAVQVSTETAGRPLVGGIQPAYLYRGGCLNSATDFCVPQP